MKKEFLLQTVKYGIIGVMNTLLAVVTIWIMMHWVFQTGKEEKVSSVVVTVSNITGYIVGLINSFVWNRKWTFKSKNHWGVEFLKFTTAFLICFFPQLILVNILNTYTNVQLSAGSFAISHAFTCQLIGIVFYTTLNFLLNKYYTFKPANPNN
jgi:putative flippase GtrA